MSNTDLWNAIYSQATAWSETPVFQKFAALLPSNTTGRLASANEVLQNLNAAGAQIDSRPLRAFSSINLMLGQVPEPGRPSESLAEWLGCAGSVEAAHREFVAWLRSRLPHYPMLRVPQLARDTPLTTSEFTWRLNWRREDFSSGLQFLPTPRNVTGLLGGSDEHRQELDRTARAVSAAFEKTDEWLAFAEAAESLQRRDLEELSTATKTAKVKLKPEFIDAYEPHMVVRRNEFRENVISTVLETLSGAAQEYVEKFTSIDTLIERAASDAFGQLAAYRNPSSFGNVSEIDVDPGVNQRVHFTLGDVRFPKLGMLVFVDDEMIPDAMLLSTVHFTHDVGIGSAFRVTGEVLKGSGDAWRNKVPN